MKLKEYQLNLKIYEEFKKMYEDKIRKDERKRILKFIEDERDNGNIEGEKGFSASLCLSKLTKMLKEGLK